MSNLKSYHKAISPKRYYHPSFQHQRGSPTRAAIKLRDQITPILKVLCALSIGHPLVRKYYRSVVLPPLRDLSKRPEVGDSARNRLCRLLTSADSSVSTMVAEYLFILCKEDGKDLRCLFGVLALLGDFL